MGERLVIIFVILIYLAFLLWIALLAKRKHVHVFWAVTIGLIFTPVFGLVAVYLMPKVENDRLKKKYVCPECDYIHSDYVEICPICAKEGKEIKVNAKLVLKKN